jgi:bacteriocin-like protein
MEKIMAKAAGKASHGIDELTEKELAAVVGGRQLPGATTPGKIVLKRGKNSSME